MASADRAETPTFIQPHEPCMVLHEVSTDTRLHREVDVMSLLTDCTQTAKPPGSSLLAQKLEYLSTASRLYP